MGGCSQLHKPAHQDARDQAACQGDSEQGQGAAVRRLPPEPDEGGDQQESLREPREAEEKGCQGRWGYFVLGTNFVTLWCLYNDWNTSSASASHPSITTSE